MSDAPKERWCAYCGKVLVTGPDVALWAAGETPSTTVLDVPWRCDARLPPADPRLRPARIDVRHVEAS